jgi:predicted nucleic acid-binding protein
MGIRYLWDTNVVIYYLQQQFPAKAEAFIDKVIATQQPIISAIIAATAMIFDLTLLTRNTSDFFQLKGLEIINPWEM